MSEEATPVLPWHTLIFGSYSHREVALVIKDVYWQTFRASLRDTSLETKFDALTRYVNQPGGMSTERKRIQVTNYVHALARGGLIEPVEKP